MLIHAEAFAVAFFGCAATNLDNIMLMLAGASREHPRPYAIAFFAVLGVAIGLALMVSLGVDVALPRVIAWAGLLPLSMGIYELRPRNEISAGRGSRAALPLAAFALTLAANSLDTLVVQTVVFTDLEAGYHGAAAVGSLTAAALIAGAGFVLLSRRGAGSRLLAAAARIRPWILILVGILILMDTGFDTI